MINIRKLESELWESTDFMSIFSIRFPKALLQMMVCFLRRNPL